MQGGGFAPQKEAPPLPSNGQPLMQQAMAPPGQPRAPPIMQQAMGFPGQPQPMMEQAMVVAMAPPGQPRVPLFMQQAMAPLGQPMAQPMMQQGMAPPGQPMAQPMMQQGIAPPGQVHAPQPMYMAQPIVQTFGFQAQPKQHQCQFCQTVMVTQVQSGPSLGTHLVACGLCGIGLSLGCCLIPYCLDDTKEHNHHCSKCNRLVGRKIFLTS